MARFILCIFVVSVSYCRCMGQWKYSDNMINSRIEGQYLHPWQIEIAKKEHKNVLDYYLLLPKQLLIGELGITDKRDTKEFRLNSIKQENPAYGRVNIKAGFLVASPDAFIKMALFKDRLNNRDILSIVLGCGEPPVQYCDFGFVVFDKSSLKWYVNKEVFPWKKFYAKCDSITSAYTGTEYFLPNIILPEFGTTISVIDAWNGENSVFKIDWTGKQFVVR